MALAKPGDKRHKPAPGPASPLFEAVWANNEPNLRKALADGADCNQLSHKGDTAVHLALRLGHLKMVQILVEAGANLLIRDCEEVPTMLRMAVFADAIRPFARAIFRAFEHQTKIETDRRLAHLGMRLQELPDFKLQLTFNFHTWIPFVGRFLPSDTCVITKCAGNLRVDTTLGPFRSLRWQRGRLSILFSSAGIPHLTGVPHGGGGSGGGGGGGGAGSDHHRAPASRTLPRLVVLDHIKSRFAVMDAAPFSTATIDKTIDGLVGSSMPMMNWWSREVVFEPVRSWWGRHPVTETLGPWNTHVYKMEHLKVRVLHRPPLDLERAKEIKKRQSEQYGGGLDLDEREVEDDEGDGAAAAAAASGGGALSAASVDGDSNTEEGVEGLAEGEREQEVAGVELSLTPGGQAEKVFGLDAGVKYTLQWEFKSPFSQGVTWQATFLGRPGDASPVSARPEDGDMVVPPVTATQAHHDICQDTPGVLRCVWTLPAEADEVVVVRVRCVPAAAVATDALGTPAVGDDAIALEDDLSALELREVVTPGLSELSLEAQPYTAAAATECAWKPVAYSDYFGAPPPSGCPATVNFVYPPECREQNKEFSAKVHMADNFPISLEQLMPVFDVIARTSSHFENVAQFMNTKLPPGFPVRFDVPIMATVSALVNFDRVDLVSEPINVEALLAGATDCTREFRHGKFFDNLGTQE